MACFSTLRISPNVLVILILCLMVLSMLFCVDQSRHGISISEHQPSHWKVKYSAFYHNNNTNDVKLRVENNQFYLKSQLKYMNENFVNSSVKDRNYTENNNKTATRQFERIQQFKKQCKLYELVNNNTESIEGLKVLHSEEYRLAYKLVPKIGSTFMIQVFTTLKSHGNIGNLLSLPRIFIHIGQAKQFRTIIDLNSLKSYKLLFMARNPYSRLYSAYIDKVFILNCLGLCRDILSTLFGREEQKHMCTYAITFEQFLEYYLEKDGALLKAHYGPILSDDITEKLCNVPNIFIVKQETFTEDIEYVLKSAHVRGKEYDLIYDIMHSKQTKTTIVSVVKTIFLQFYYSMQNHTCLTWKDIAVRLWKSFQVQGYIDERSEFPDTKFNVSAEYENDTYVIKVIMQEVDKNPLTEKQKVRQRNNALLKAYKDIDERYIRKIHERYAMDFDMFQYNTDLVKS